MNMNSYLLLRDNKQTGPYTLDELITKGLKPYDLIWIEGKSAGWRYPSEVPELIAYAPTVEEQPYDRFFKKPSNTQTKAEPKIEPSTAAIEIKNEPVFVKPSPKEETNVNHPNRKVYVNFPASVAKRSNGNTEEKPVEKRSVVEKPPVVEPTPVVEKQNLSFSKDENKEFEKYLPADPGKTREQKSEPETIIPAIQPQKFSTSVFGEKESNGNVHHSNSRLPDEQENGNGNSSRYHSYPKKKKLSGSLVFGIAAVCILLAGVGIGLFISYSNQKNNSSELDKLVQQIKEKEKARQVIPASNPVEEKTNIQPTSLSTVDNVDNNAVPPQTTAQVKKHPNNSAKKESTSNNGALHTQDLDEDLAKENKPTVSEKQEQKEAINEQAIKSTRERINQLINIENNSFKTGVLGGISNLQLTLSNNSLYPLDEVEVEIRYLGPEKRVVKRTNIQFTDIRAGEQKTLTVPKSKRGVGIEYTIMRVSSKALGIAKAGQ
jgi:hypothetical protein